MTTSQRGIRACIIFAAVLAISFTTTFAGNPPPLAFEWQHFENGVYLRGTPWSPDNRYLAVSSLEGDALLLLDRETWEVDRRLELPATEAALQRLRWSPNGNYIAVANNKELIVLNVRDGSHFHLTQLMSPTGGHQMDVRWLGNTNMLSVLDSYGLIILIDVVEQENIREIQLDDYPAGGAFIYTAFDWNPPFELFAVPLHDTYTIGFWDEFGNLPNDLIQQDVLEPYLSASQCGSLSADSPTPEFNFFGMGVNVAVKELQWSNDGLQLAYTIDNVTVVCTLNTEATSVERVRKLYIPNPVYDPDPLSSPYNTPHEIIWSPDDLWLLMSLFYVPPGMLHNSCGIAVFDVANDFAYRGKIGEEFCHVWGMSWSPDGRQLALGNGADGYWVGTLQAE